MYFKFFDKCQSFISIYLYNLKLKLSFIGNGTLNAAFDGTDLDLSIRDGFVKYECSKDTDTLCYFLALNGSNHKVCQFDYTSTGSISLTEPSISTYSLVSFTPITGENIIVAGFDASSTPHKFILYSSNHSSTSVNWAVETNATGKLRDLCYNGKCI